MTPKEIVEGYYRDMFLPEGIRPYLHPNCVIHWNGTRGYIELSPDELVAMIFQLRESFSTSRLELTHVIAEGNQVAVRYAHNITSADTFEEKTFAYSMAVWEIQDGKMYTGYIMSHLE